MNKLNILLIIACSGAGIASRLQAAVWCHKDGKQVINQGACQWVDYGGVYGGNYLCVANSRDAVLGTVGEFIKQANAVRTGSNCQSTGKPQYNKNSGLYSLEITCGNGKQAGPQGTNNNADKACDPSKGWNNL